MNKSFKYIPKDKRKKILLICDDIRVHSGVATIAKEIVVGTCQHFNWVNIAGAIKHPEAGKRLDISAATNKESGIEESFFFNNYNDNLRNLNFIPPPDFEFHTFALRNR